MQRTNYLIALCFIIFLPSCKNKTVAMLSKKWDYVKMENVDTKPKFLSVEDSVANANMEMAKKLLTWTFNKNMSYECAVGNRTATSGTYSLSEGDKTLTLVPSTKSNAMTYTIKSLSESELVLTGLAENVPVTLYFREH